MSNYEILPWYTEYYRSVTFNHKNMFAVLNDIKAK